MARSLRAVCFSDVSFITFRHRAQSAYDTTNINLRDPRRSSCNWLYSQQVYLVLILWIDVGMLVLISSRAVMYTRYFVSVPAKCSLLRLVSNIFIRMWLRARLPMLNSTWSLD